MAELASAEMLEVSILITLFLKIIVKAFAIWTQFVNVQEIANVHSHYARMKNSLLPPSAGVTLQNLAGSVKKCTLEYKQWQEKIAVSPSNARH